MNVITAVSGMSGGYVSIVVQGVCVCKDFNMLSLGVALCIGEEV